MADGGYKKLWNKAFDHPFWTEKRVFSRWEAWTDCWANMAAWKDHERMVSGKSVSLKRGEFIASDRFLERRWRWSRGKVRRFMAELVDKNMLETRDCVNGGCSIDGTSGGTTYLVVTYEHHQGGGTRDGTTDSTTDGPKSKKVKKVVTDVTTWVKQAGDAWVERFGGTANFGAIGKQLKPIVGRYGASEVLDAWKRYLFSSKVEAQFKSPAHFAQKYGEWQEGRGTAPSGVTVADIRRCLTLGGSYLPIPEFRATAYEQIEKGDAELWGRVRSIAPKIDWTYLNGIKGNAFDLTKAIESALRQHAA